MQTHTTIRRFGAGCLVLAVCGLVGCGSSAKSASPPTTVTSTTTRADSAYCDTVRRWTVHELAAFDDGDPAAMEKWAHDYATYVREGAAQAPASLRADWAVSKRGVEHTFLPLLEKYHYSIEALQTRGTKAEQALLDDPPAPIAEAQDRLHQYAGSVCATERPEPAEVTFKGPASSAYCALVRADKRAVDEIQVVAHESPASATRLRRSGIS